METITPSQLRARVTATGSPYFSRATMKFFGDTMRNYGTRCHTLPNGRRVVELYRRRPVKGGLRDSAFFGAETFARVHIDGDTFAQYRAMVAEREAWMADHDWRLLEDNPRRRCEVWAMACPDEADELNELMESIEPFAGLKSDMQALAEGRA